MIRKLSMSLLVGVGMCSASDAFTPPLIGYVAGPSNEVRAIVGTPGAARVTFPVALPQGIDRIALAPGRTFGLASMTETESVVVLHSLNTQPAASLIVGAAKNFHRAAFSTSGKAVALFSRECGCVQTITGLPDAPAVSRTINVAERDILALATNDDASVIAYSSTGELARYDGDSVSTWPVSARWLALSSDALTLAVVDADRRTVSTLRAGEWSATLAEGDPVAVTFAGLSSMVVADSSAGVRLIDTSAGSVTLVECACTPGTAEPTSLNDAFRITGLDTRAVWLLHVAETGSRIVFVPVQQAELQETEQ